MASTAGATGWLRGKVKAVPSGDSLVIMGSTKAEIPPEKTITLSSLIAPRLARRGGVDEPFAWESREYLRKLCMGKDVTFKVDYTVPSIGREFGSVFLGDKNVALMVVSDGWVKVREQGQQKGDASPFLAELLRLEEQAKQQGLGRWTRTPGASEASIRNLPPSAMGGDPGNLDAMGLLASNKGKPMQAIVEQVRDGSTLRVYLLPEFQFVQVFVAGIQAPSMGRRAASETVVGTEVNSDELNVGASAEPHVSLTSAQRLAASSASSNEVAPDPFAREAKHFTEIRALHRDVRIVLEGVDKFSNLIGSIYYPDGESAKDLALELVENGLAKYVEWSASLMEEDAKRKLKSAELQAKKTRLRIWTNYIPPATNSKAIHDQNFTGKVVEVVSGDCVIVADDSVPYGSPLAERRVNLSSIRCPKMGNPRRDEKPAPYAREAKEFLRQRLIGRQVNVSMEYSRKVSMADGLSATVGSADSRVMDFGSVFLVSPVKVEGDDAATPAPSTGGSQQAGVNVAELVVARGFGTIVNAPRGAVESPKDKFEVFYIDYGNQEVVPYSQLRPVDPSVSSAPGLALLCSLAYIKVPSLEEDYGQEAAMCLSEHTLNGPKEFKAIIEERDTSGGKVKGQGTGTIHMVTLIDTTAGSSINAAMLKDGLARMEKRRRWEPKEKQAAMDELEKFQAEARNQRLAMWEYGDIQSDDEDSAPPLRKAGGGKR
ncbi:hypothetical protein ACSBR2_023624 [Camellia fascicularis]